MLCYALCYEVSDLVTSLPKTHDATAVAMQTAVVALLTDPLLMDASQSADDKGPDTKLQADAFVALNLRAGEELSDFDFAQQAREKKRWPRQLGNRCIAPDRDVMLQARMWERLAARRTRLAAAGAA